MNLILIEPNIWNFYTSLLCPLATSEIDSYIHDCELNYYVNTPRESDLAN